MAASGGASPTSFNMVSNQRARSSSLKRVSLCVSLSVMGTSVGRSVGVSSSFYVNANVRLAPRLYLCFRGGGGGRGRKAHLFWTKMQWVVEEEAFDFFSLSVGIIFIWEEMRLDSPLLRGGPLNTNKTRDTRMVSSLSCTCTEWVGVGKE